MRLKLAKMRRRLFGGRVLTLEAVEDGVVARNGSVAMDLVGNTALVRETAKVRTGQTLTWPVSQTPDIAVGDVIQSSQLPPRPGPKGLHWQSAHVL